MIMRVTDGLRIQASLLSLERVRKGSRDLLEQMGTQQRINRPSDDPAGVERLLEWKTVRGDIARYQGQIQQTSQWLRMTDLVLGRAADLVGQAAELAEGNVCSDEANRQNAIRALEAIESELFTLANTRCGERCLFAGSAAGVVPFVRDTDAFGNPIVRYDGNDESLVATIGGNATLEYSVSGTEAFVQGGRSLFQVLAELKSALGSGDGAAIGQLRVELEGFRRQTTQVQSISGVRQQRLQSAAAHLSVLDQKLSGLMDDAQNVDLAELAAAFTMQEVALNASYEMTARIGDMSILAFLK
jgi:flagellar hook-associated protein 3 FlgL